MWRIFLLADAAMAGGYMFFPGPACRISVPWIIWGSRAAAGNCQRLNVVEITGEEMAFQFTRTYRGKVQLVIFDWAGTTVDFGCQAPVAAFVEGFRDMGVEVTREAARGPMGMEKRAHIEAVSALDEVARRWQEVHKRSVNDSDIDIMFEKFSSLLLDSIAAQSVLIPGISEVIETLRSRGVRIGASTGYFSEAADLVVKGAAGQGYIPDYTTCASEVPAGRPAPWMIYRVMQALDVYPPGAVVNVGDTPVDIESGLNAGVWSIGVAATGNQMGLSAEELRALTPEQYKHQLSAARESLSRAGAHYVIDTMEELPAVIEKIEDKLASGSNP